VLLEDEYYLLKVFEHLIDYGLHEVRRVCRKWYQVSKKLPVKLKKVPIVCSADVAEHFPNVTQLDIDEYACDGILYKYHHQGSMVNQLSHLTSLQNLNAFSLCLRLRPETAEVLSQLLQSLSGLQSLKLSHVFQDEDIELCSQIRYLTKLTLLEMYVRLMERPRLAPFTELKNIQTLKLGCYFSNEDGHFMFPALTNLTHLDLGALPVHIAKINQALEAFLPHRSSLRTLVIGHIELPRVLESWLIEFTRLESLKLPVTYSLPSRTSNPELSDALRALRGLTCLRGVGLNEHSAGLVESFCSLTKLESLTLNLQTYADAYLLSLSRLSRLTHLSLRDVSNKLQPISISSTSYTWSEIIATLNLKCLESLELSDLNVNVPFQGGCLAGAEKLKQLRLNNIHLGNMFFPTLGWLKQLEVLRLEFCKGFDQVSFADIRFLTNLETLKLYHGETAGFFDCLVESRLPRLKYLNVVFLEPSQEMKMCLSRSFPCLRKFL